MHMINNRPSGRPATTRRYTTGAKKLVIALSAEEHAALSASAKGETVTAWARAVLLGASENSKAPLPGRAPASGPEAEGLVRGALQTGETCWLTPIYSDG